MEGKVNYTIVGLMVIILTTAFITCALWLSIGFNQKSYKIYAVYMHETVSGLNEESPVKYNGVPVGQVKIIEINHQNPQQVRLLLEIEDSTLITMSTVAMLISQGITGTTYVGLTATSSDLQPLKQLPNEPYPIIASRPSLFYQLDKVLKEVSENINSVSIEVKKIFDNKNAMHIKHILNNTDIIMRDLSKSTYVLPKITQDFDMSLHKIQSIAIPSTITFINKLNTIASQLEQLSKNINQNPSIILRGSTPPQAGPGE